MQIKLSINEGSAVSFVYPDAFNTTEFLSQKEYVLGGEDCGRWEIKEVCFNHFLIKHQQFEIREDCKLNSERDFASVEMYFLLDGAFRTDLLSSEREIALTKGMHNIYHLAKGEKMHSDFYKAPGYTGLEIQFCPVFFRNTLLCHSPNLCSFFRDIDENRSAELFGGGKPITVEMERLISEILSCQPEADNRMVIFAKVVQLLSLQIAQLTAEPVTETNNILKAEDLEKIRQAKEIVYNHYQNPYSIRELSRLVGLNEFKLKKGFREMYGSSIFGYVTELRMLQSKALLSDTSLSIGEISDKVGYKTPSHFTVAFKKKFGMLPSALR